MTSLDFDRLEARLQRERRELADSERPPDVWDERRAPLSQEALSWREARDAELDGEIPLPGETYARFPSTENDPDYESRLSRDELIAGGAIDVILGRGMVALEEAITGEVRINTGNLWASLEGMPALAATFNKGPEAVFGAASLVASEREVMRGYILEALPAAEVAEYTGRTVRGTENLIVSASKALRLLSQRLACTKSAISGEM